MVGQRRESTRAFGKSKIHILNGRLLRRATSTTSQLRPAQFSCGRARPARTLTGVNAPPAAGARITWEDVPLPVRREIERVCGAPVVKAQTQPGGFSPGVAVRVRCSDGARWFVKAVSAEANPETPRMHRREASVLADLDPVIVAGQLPVPRLRGTAEFGPWFALVVDDVVGRQPDLPWQDEQLDLVLAAVGRLAQVLTPAPLTRPASSSTWGPTSPAGGHWPARRPMTASTRGRGPAWASWPRWRRPGARRPRAAPCCTATSGPTTCWSPGTAGGRGDGGGLAARVPGRRVRRPGALRAQRGDAGRSRARRAARAVPSAGRAPAGRAAALVCAMAGYLTERSLGPAPPGLPTIRASRPRRPRSPGAGWRRCSLPPDSAARVVR